jgi:hypothetical protein
MLSTETRPKVKHFEANLNSIGIEPWLRYFHVISRVIFPEGIALQFTDTFSTPDSPAIFDASFDLYTTTENFDEALLHLVAYCVRYNIRNEEQTTKLKESISLLSSFFIYPSQRLQDQQIEQINRSLKYLKSRFDFFQQIILEKLTNGDNDLSVIMSVDVYNSDVSIKSDMPSIQISIDPYNKETLGIDLITLGQIAEYLFESSYSQNSFKNMRDKLILEFSNLVAVYKQIKKPS